MNKFSKSGNTNKFLLTGNKNNSRVKPKEENFPPIFFEN
jgi:hypothetical protein